MSVDGLKDPVRTSRLPTNALSGSMRTICDASSKALSKRSILTYVRARKSKMAAFLGSIPRACIGISFRHFVSRRLKETTLVNIFSALPYSFRFRAVVPRSRNGLTVAGPGGLVAISALGLSES